MTDKATGDNADKIDDIPIRDMFQYNDKFAVINRMITRDLNNNPRSNMFYKYKKDDIAKYLSNPQMYEKNLRDAVIYVYSASSHFRRLIQYFVGLSDLCYVINPYKINPDKVNVRLFTKNYQKVLNTMASLNPKTQLAQILTVCLREDVYYGTLRVTDSSIIIQQLPSDYCKITVIQDGVPNVTFDFSYFTSRQDLLPMYPEEFTEKFHQYQKDRKMRWIELEAPNSFAVKCNTDILDYAVPPFAGLLRNVYDLEDYQTLKLSKTELENYALVWMRLPMDSEGNWLLDGDKGKEFWSNLNAVVPEEVATVLSPMDIEKISFERTHTGDTDTVAEAEQNLYTAAGVSSLLFNNEKAAASALLLSIKADQAITFGIVKSIENVINRYLHYQSYGKNFAVNFLDISPFNRKEMGDAYLKGCTYGFDMRRLYWASQGLSEIDLNSMNFLETTILGLDKKLMPVRSSNSADASASSATDTERDVGEAGTAQPGRPKDSDEELTESGEETRDQENW